ncbi:DUF308 domain-containing protein [Streptomyces sp. NPDC001795]|uniref:DUF308 domain-containing protein n=1 Tax=Streptomyces sp. NPDC001795 TaxID=3154525 RepID=UPI0033227C50
MGRVTPRQGKGCAASGPFRRGRVVSEREGHEHGQVDGPPLLRRGLLAVVVGVVALAWPGITLAVFVVAFSVYALLAAGIDLRRAFSSDRAGPALGYLLLALLSFVAAFGALTWPGVTGPHRLGPADRLERPVKALQPEHLRLGDVPDVQDSTAARQGEGQRK